MTAHPAQAEGSLAPIFELNPGGGCRLTVKALTKKERLARQARGQEVDRVPSLGGWIGGARVVAEIAGISTDEYLADPMAGVVKAGIDYKKAYTLDFVNKGVGLDLRPQN